MSKELSAVKAQEPEQIHVGIGEYKIAFAPHVLVTLGLGSCVGVTLYDPVMKCGGLLHVMLPDSTAYSRINKPARYADLGVPMLLDELKKLGARRERLEAKLAGGAQMFSGADRQFILNIGQRNVEMVRLMLARLKLRVKGEEVGGNVGRTMYLDTATGLVTIRSLGQGTRTL
ncbi:MAG: chemotaxis protein CheD [Thermoanaerobacterales bacterium]|nr:chemotaxis protein CheD [Bacillota bacterium]MDI6906117.1 chemotaxis protein CheD [Thermoanaerobacterales bacterium]